MNYKPEYSAVETAGIMQSFKKLAVNVPGLWVYNVREYGQSWDAIVHFDHVVITEDKSEFTDTIDFVVRLPKTCVNPPADLRLHFVGDASQRYAQKHSLREPLEFLVRQLMYFAWIEAVG